jgi:hypothetical protein
LAAISRVCLSLHHSASISLPRPCGAHPSLFQGAPCATISFYLCAYHQIGCLLFSLYPTALDLGCRRDTHSFYLVECHPAVFFSSASVQLSKPKEGYTQIGRDKNGSRKDTDWRNKNRKEGSRYSQPHMVLNSLEKRGGALAVLVEFRE